MGLNSSSLRNVALAGSMALAGGAPVAGCDDFGIFDSKHDASATVDLGETGPDLSDTDGPQVMVDGQVVDLTSDFAGQLDAAMEADMSMEGSPDLAGADLSGDLAMSSDLSGPKDAATDLSRLEDLVPGQDLTQVQCQGFPKPCKNGTCDGGVGVAHCDVTDAGNEQVQCRCQ